jgi:hypothetical protein
MRKLGQLLLRGGVTVGICAATALCIAGFLSLIASSLQPKKRVAAAPFAIGCKHGHCHPKVAAQQVVAKVQ